MLVQVETKYLKMSEEENKTEPVAPEETEESKEEEKTEE